MSRPTKQGIIYFPLDTQFDDKIELLIADKGSDALSVLITTWQLIYQNEGYYIKNGKDFHLLVRRRIMLEIDRIDNIIEAAISRNVFDESLHKKYKILTSKAIQKRYFLAGSRKKIINVYKNYLLVRVNEYKNINSLGVNVVHLSLKEKEKEKESENSQKVSMLANHFLSLILERNPGHKQPDLQKWCIDIDKMIRIDKRPPEEIEKIINWCQNDTFWQTNILSPSKLRHKYDQLYLKFNQENPKRFDE